MNILFGFSIKVSSISGKLGGKSCGLEFRQRENGVSRLTVYDFII
ncbi:hypothetical protein ASZ90_003203 [hydrocarbon metagenome]|uniref:Uncharacterized protein n=1 Tax=hydrocarbon metagenome TaxID=938273 RepID=A0A0W8G1P0_9ZZZZ